MARDVRVAILGDARDFKRAVSEVQSGTKRMDRALGGVRKAAIGLGSAFVATEAVRFGQDLIEAAEEAQKVTRQTAAVIKSQGNAAKVSAKHVEQLASALSLKAGIDDELIQSGQNVLLTFRNIRNEVGKGNDVFDQATTLTLDLSVALKKDMNSSAILVGKALNDPIKGITALTRAGVQFTDQQKAQIRAMVAAGDTLGAQKMILAELEAQFAGSAEAQATASGKLATAWDNAKERLGEALQPAVEKLALWLADNLPGAIDTTVAKARELKEWVDQNQTAAYGLAIAFGVLAVSIFAASFPISATVLGLAALILVTDHLIERWQIMPRASRFFQTGIDNILGPLVTLIERLAEAVGLLEEFLRLVRSASNVAGGALGVGEASEDTKDDLRDRGLLPPEGRAAGGFVRRGRSYLVGERGPEMVTMGGNGFVTPNHALGGGDGIGITINGNVDRDTLADMLHELRKVRLQVAS